MPATRHEEIADELTEEILRGQYRVGERLPSERDLSARFEANRGAVREAIKKLEQLRLADVQPGGARVLPVEESSLDVLGHLLALDEIPDPELVDQMLEVMNALMSVAARRAIRQATDEEIARARALIARVQEPDLPHDELAQTRLEIGRHFLKMSGNLVLALIGRSLRIQVMGRANNPTNLLHSEPKRADHDAHLRQLDRALAARDADATVATLQALADHNRTTVLAALRAAHAGSNGQRKLAS